ncbi:alpha-2-macroglobulin-like isoform X3 [Boleophthalmus pectinirostris]|uniref:alpha-2-macroglobulin-like isoform X3 n=1 Tax=Boleophthalmus pectinirostris TaxID=150288 RepID=UPI00242FEF54|nr:alpha-2-macroglobulin-like isoform X3 [Boleophthalmus pectinirostris]
MKDYRGNRVAQWLEQSSSGRILQLTFDLDPHAVEGTYSVSVKVKGQRHPVTHTFVVEKYVLPKFSVEVEAPDEVSIALEELSFKVCTKYTFGQSVPGQVEVSVCRDFEPQRYSPSPKVNTPVCHKEVQEVPKDGCASFSIPTSQFKNISRMEAAYSINAMMIEEGTDLKQSVTQKIKISYEIGKVEFVNPPKRYKRGEVLELQVKVVHYNNTPVSHTEVHLITEDRYDELQKLKTDQDGHVTFSFNTSSYSDSVGLKASMYEHDRHSHLEPHFITASLRLQEIKRVLLHTRTTSSLEVKGEDRTLACGDKESFTVGYSIVGEGQGIINLIYLVLSRGVIVKYGHYSSCMDTTMKGELTFDLEITGDLVPAVTVVTYAVLPSANVIATSREYSTEKCFTNKVQVQFSPPSSVPGEDSSLSVSAAPLSLCGLSAVDKSVLIQKPGKSLDPDKFLSLLPVQTAEFFPDSIEDIQECTEVCSRQYVIHPRRNTDEVYYELKKRGLKLVTNLFIQTPFCVNVGEIEYRKDFEYYKFEWMEMLKLPPPIVTVRTFFPETWIWDLVEVGPSGQASLSVSVPDTITSWETDAFCLSSDQGIGLAARQQLTVFQPFFLEQVLPYSIIRGESFILKATVFNYLQSCIMMDVQAAPSAGFTLTPLSSDQYRSCLCGNERKTLSWILLASSLGEVNVTVTAEAVSSDVPCDNEVQSLPERGRKDVVTRTLRVKAEGTEVSKTFNWLLCPKDEPLKEQVDLTLPEDVIPGSARASVSVVGDVLGRAMKNLDGLLKMPYGCGEQNMALLAPNIYILEYLKNTQQLSPDVTDKALKFLHSGYQRQLNYQHSDGGYSAFGRGDANTWLTAFVVRCFSKARAFVYIDPTKITLSRTWLMSRQKDDGCFRPSGELFNNRMKGGVSDDVTLSAYITAAFLEMNMTESDSVVERSLSCLKNHSENLENLYTTALMAYVFSLAGDTETRAQLLHRLSSRATDEGGQVHWSSSSSSLSVEISSYVLLSVLTAPSVGVEDLSYASKIVRWLTGQQNPYGGFQSTQDTVVALQALSLYSAVVYSPDGSSTVLVRDLNRPTEGSLSFTVEPSNKLLYQERPLGGAAGQYSVEVTGSACTSIQVSLFYNVPVPSEVRTLGVKVETQMECGGSVLQLLLQAEYGGEQNSTNMVILDVKMLSGFVPHEASLKNLEFESGVDRVERNEDHILLYIKELSKDVPVSFRLRLVEEIQVQNLKPAVVRIYDYYQPSDEAETEYTSPCAAPNKH